jgi:membrane-associated protein
VFSQFIQFVSDASGWAYAVVFLLALLDAIVPAVPSETAVITAGAVAVGGHLSVPLIVASAATGALAGDNIAYLIGRYFGPAATRRFFSGARQRIAWAERQLDKRGGQLILVGRFIPGGRTVVTLSAGLLRFRWRRFLTFDAAAALVWALYATLLGYLGGRAFEHAPWIGLLLALGTGFAITGIVEAVQWVLRRRRGRAGSGPLGPAADPAAGPDRPDGTDQPAHRDHRIFRQRAYNTPLVVALPLIVALTFCLLLLTGHGLRGLYRRVTKLLNCRVGRRVNHWSGGVPRGRPTGFRWPA